MDALTTLVVLYLLAACAWAWLVWVADRGLPVTILVQQRLGVCTPRPLYRVARRGRWLAAGGAAVAAVGVLAGLGTMAPVGLLAVAFALLTYIHAGMAKSRVLAGALETLDAGRPDEPPPEEGGAGEPVPVA